MNKNTAIKLSLIALALVLVGGVGALVWSGRATALGNSAIPVRCYKTSTLQPGNAAFLTCQSAGGVAFVDNQRVPNGYYFVVTDVLITPDAGLDTTGITDLTLYDAYGDNGRSYSFRLRETRAATFGPSFAAPYMVLIPGHRLEATLAGFSANGVEVRVSGWLVTNLDYLPLALRK
jgi:hypothetical protein